MPTAILHSIDSDILSKYLSLRSCEHLLSYPSLSVAILFVYAIVVELWIEILVKLGSFSHKTMPENGLNELIIIGILGLCSQALEL